MIKSNCLRILASFSGKELQELVWFAECPLYNRAQGPIKLLHYLKQHRSQWHPLYIKCQLLADAKRDNLDRLEAIIGKDLIFTTLFPEKDLSDANIRQIISQTKKLAERFIQTHIVMNSQEEELRGELRLLEYFLYRGEEKLYAKANGRMQKRIKQIKFHNLDTYQFKAKVAEQRLSYLIRTGRKEDSVQEWANSFDQFFVLAKLRQYASMQSRNTTRGIEYDDHFKDGVLAGIEQYAHLQEPLIQIWRRIIQLREHPDSNALFSQLTDLVSSHQSLIQSNQLRMIYATMLNYLYPKNRKSEHNHHLSEIFRFSKTMVETGAIYINGKINVKYFNACVRAAIEAKQFLWAEEFIHSNADKLLGPNPDNLIDYTILVLYFKKGDFQFVIDRIDKLTFGDKNKEILRRILKFQTLYELGVQEAKDNSKPRPKDRVEDFFRFSNTLKRYIQYQEQVGQNVKQLYTNFVKTLEKIGRARFNRRTLPKSFEEDLDHIQLAERDWLLEKLKELRDDE